MGVTPLGSITLVHDGLVIVGVNANYTLRPDAEDSLGLPVTDSTGRPVTPWRSFWGTEMVTPESISSMAVRQVMAHHRK